MIRPVAVACLLVLGTAACSAAGPEPVPVSTTSPTSAASPSVASLSSAALTRAATMVRAPRVREGEFARTVFTIRSGRPNTNVVASDTTKKAVAADDWILQMACSAPTGTGSVSLRASVADASKAPAPGEAARVLLDSTVACDGTVHNDRAQGLHLGRLPVQINLGLGDAQQVTAAWAVLMPASVVKG